MEPITNNRGLVYVEDWAEAKDTLRQWLEEGSRKSLRTVELGRFLLERGKTNLRNEGRPTTCGLELGA